MTEFLEYLRNKKSASENTLVAYRRDIGAFEKFLGDTRAKFLDECTESDAVSYVMEMNNEGKSKSTINRKVSALRTYYEYKITRGSRQDNPFSKIKTAKSDVRAIDYLTVEEITKLLELPDDSRKGLRDRALIEFMYGSGARVTEVVRIKVEDINLRMGFATLKDADDQSRIVPLGSYAKDAIRNYLQNSFVEYMGREPDADDTLFVNMRGEALTRQGIWKTLKEYGEKIGIGEKMTPQILRDSYAVHILQNGGDLKTLQELMGFDDMTVGLAYLSVTEIHVREVFAKCHPRA